MTKYAEMSGRRVALTYRATDCSVYKLFTCDEALILAMEILVAVTTIRELENLSGTIDFHPPKESPCPTDT